MRHVIVWSLVLLVIGFGTIASLFYVEHRNDPRIIEKTAAAKKRSDSVSASGGDGDGSAPSDVGAREPGAGSSFSSSSTSGQQAALSPDGMAARKRDPNRTPTIVIELAPPASSAGDPKEVRETMAKKAERTANWRDYHCKLMYRYYGEDEYPPFGPLLGLGEGASQDAVGRRCEDLLDYVKLSAGFPSDKQPIDNYIVCDGFEWVSTGSFKITVTPRRQDLRKGKLAYSGTSGKFRFTPVSDTHASPIGDYAFPLLVRVDDKCIVLSFYRGGYRNPFLGKIYKAKPRSG